MQVDLLTSSSPLKKKLTSQVAIEPRKLKDTFSFTELLTSLKRLYTISFQFSHHSCQNFSNFLKKYFFVQKNILCQTLQIHYRISMHNAIINEI